MGAYIFFMVFVFVSAILAVLLDLRGAWKRWGAKEDEIEKRYPAHDLIPDAEFTAVRGITILASPSQVWPWVAQNARGAGFYSWDFLDNFGYQSANYLMEIPQPALGDTSIIGELRFIETGHSLAWVIEKTSWMLCKWDVCFNYIVEPAGECRSRLLLVVRGRFSGNRFWGMAGALLNDAIETFMAVKQLKELKRIVETYPDRLEARDFNRSVHGHQRSKYTYAQGKALPDVSDSKEKG